MNPVYQQEEEKSKHCWEKHSHWLDIRKLERLILMYCTYTAQCLKAERGPSVQRKFRRPSCKNTSSRIKAPMTNKRSIEQHLEHCEYTSSFQTPILKSNISLILLSWHTWQTFFMKINTIWIWPFRGTYKFMYCTLISSSCTKLIRWFINKIYCIARRTWKKDL